MNKPLINAPAIFVPRVDLLDPNTEPTEEALDALMSAALESALRKREKANTAFFANMQQEIEAALGHSASHGKPNNTASRP